MDVTASYAMEEDIHLRGGALAPNGALLCLVTDTAVLFFQHTVATGKVNEIQPELPGLPAAYDILDVCFASSSDGVLHAITVDLHGSICVYVMDNLSLCSKVYCSKYAVRPLLATVSAAPASGDVQIALVAESGDAISIGMVVDGEHTAARQDNAFTIKSSNVSHLCCATGNYVATGKASCRTVV